MRAGTMVRGAGTLVTWIQKLLALLALAAVLLCFSCMIWGAIYFLVSCLQKYF